MLRVWLVVVLIIIGLVFIHFGIKHAATVAGNFTNISTTTSNSIRSGFSGACLDVYHSKTINGTPIDAANCNSTGAQDWTTTATTIRQANTDSCVNANSGGAIVLSTCASVPGQVWLRDQEGYYNPNTGECLNESNVGVQLRLGSCANMSSDGVLWTPNSAAQVPACGGSRGTAIACEAVKQWTAWVANGPNHEALLTTYTDGTPYEEWCADFVSYVYQQAGYAFTNGSADGWDENNANDVQYMGFTMHQAGNGYVPKTGDVAFFDYPGGHVEIVVSGGPNPTFVYGDSAQIDPTTGNGQMKANTILSESDGQVEYYLTPNS